MIPIITLQKAIFGNPCHDPMNQTCDLPQTSCILQLNKTFLCQTSIFIRSLKKTWCDNSSVHMLVASLYRMKCTPNIYLIGFPTTKYEVTSSLSCPGVIQLSQQNFVTPFQVEHDRPEIVCWDPPHHRLVLCG